MVCCDFCEVEKTSSQEGTWWFLSGRPAGFWGYCCPQCYECVSHDAFGEPRNPELFTWFLLKHSEEQRSSTQGKTFARLRE